ncbi:hypothetical protein [Kitasatospora sp. MAP5-34]|uniref:hypothetical protein n=1 Tax=Kitasatospora sp. MAP5-34 TaxID=3035102 RepID=UPI00247597A0|nr:hypothetical protein [Kitasatospora sp. MAP5-34]MDH6577636.1 hypothetical protein [Kitasatospora sp. MAP5-34]
MTFRNQSRRTRLRVVHGGLGLSAVLIGLAAALVGGPADTSVRADPVTHHHRSGEITEWNNTGS